ncbi:TetR/AcrR family transcriptional regulator [Sphaerisporangium sp. NBC_01403]|uniref:TetR/AcrR family transcriptional regulator n=1 Tax=Sphaerisporangium sp. NBC_01403 TaxID=2903599 RepID=UPI00325128D5
MDSNVKGRPRDPKVNIQVSRAVPELLREIGYQQMTVEAIARRAGVSRPAIYRRWRSKADIVLHVLFERAGSGGFPPPTGDLRADLGTWVSALLARFGRPEVAAAYVGLMADLRDRRGFSVELVWPGRDHLAETLSMGGARPEADAEVLFELLVGAILLRLAGGGPVDDAAYQERLTDLLFHAVAETP